MNLTKTLDFTDVFKVFFSKKKGTENPCVGGSIPSITTAVKEKRKFLLFFCVKFCHDSKNWIKYIKK